MKNKIIFTLTLNVLLGTVIQAQSFIGMQQSNYSGTQGAFYNPAKLAQNRIRLCVDLFGVDATINNSKYILNKDSVFNGSFSYKSSDTTSPVSIAAPILEMRLPSIMYSVNKKLGIAFTSRVRFFNQINEINPYLINFATSNTINLSSLQNINDSKGFNMNIHAFTDIGVSAGYNLIDNKKLAVNIGASLRMYNGVGYFNFNDKGIVGQLIPANGNTPALINVSNIDLNISTSAFNFSSLSTNFSNPTNAFNSLFSKAAGNGIGGDLGAEIILKNTKKKKYKGVYSPYCIKLGGSLQDIGTMKYKSVTSLIVKGSGLINSDSLADHLENYYDLKEYFRRNNFTLDSNTSSKIISLPTKLNLYTDYSINSRFFVAGTALISLAQATNNNPYYYSQLSLVPRFETKAIEVCLPFSYNFMSKDIKPGIGCRFGPLYFGSSDVKLLLQDAKGGNVYAGARIAINKRRKKEPKAISNTIEVKDERKEIAEIKAPVEEVKKIVEEKIVKVPKVEEVKEIVVEKIKEKVIEKTPEPIKEELKKRVSFAAKSIQFQTGKTIILQTSNASLDKVVAILKENADYNLNIEGHTDNVGNAAKNLLLSTQRAESVKKYFISKGIDASRLTTNGFGDSQPITDNKTELGRKVNRRVELKIKN